MAKKDRIPKTDFQDLQKALALLSDYAEEMLAAVKENEVLSTNFTSGMRGADLVYKTIEGVVGSAKTAPAWDLLEPLLEKWASKDPKPKQLVEKGEAEVKRNRSKSPKG